MAGNRFVLDRSWSSVFASSSGNLRILDGTKDKGQKVGLGNSFTSSFQEVRCLFQKSQL